MSATTGSVTFSLGPASAAGLVSLGTATLAGSGGVSTATLTVKGSSLAVGSDVIAATYAGTVGFAGSAGSTTVSVTAARTSNVIVGRVEDYVCSSRLSGQDSTARAGRSSNHTDGLLN